MKALIVCLVVSATTAWSASPQSCGPGFSSGLSRMLARIRGKETYADRLARKIGGLEVRGKDGKTSRFEVAPRGGADDAVVDFDVFQGTEKAGYGVVMVMPDGSLTLGGLTLQRQGQGVGKALARLLFESAPSGGKIALASTNGPTNARLEAIARGVMSRADFREQARANPAAARELLDRELTQIAEALFERGGTDGVLWVNVLRGAGWNRVEVTAKWDASGRIIGYDLMGIKDP